MRPRRAAVALLGLSTLAVTLSNFYGGLIAAVITPAAVAAYWLVMRPAHRRPTRALTITAISLVLIAACGLTNGVVRRTSCRRQSQRLRGSARGAFPVQREVVELSRSASRASVCRSGREGHVGNGWCARRPARTTGVSRLGHPRALRRRRRSVGLAHPQSTVGHRRSRARARRRRCHRTALLVVAGASDRSQLVAAPSALLYSVLPMFRAYARFGVVVQLMAALLAGIGIDFLRRAGTTRARFACIALVALVAVEYAVAPWTLWRDVLPTPAHRWVARQPGDVRALDCTPLNRKNQSIQWLTANRVLLSSRSPSGCTEPNFSDTLAAGGYTHLLVWRDTAEARWFAKHEAPGFRVAANFEDGQVLAVTAAHPAIYTAAMRGFFGASTARKARGDGWRRTPPGRSPTPACSRSSRRWPLSCGRSTRPRVLELRLDGRHVQSLGVARARRVYQVGPLVVPPGDHLLMFHSADAPTSRGPSRAATGARCRLPSAPGHGL